MSILENLGELFGGEKKNGDVAGVTGFKPEENIKGIEVKKATQEELAEAERKLTQKLAGKMSPEDVKWDVDKAA